MKSFRRHNAEINAGSMADIAFLLLLFFLVATTISVDKGIKRELPKPCPPDTDCSETVKQNNILNILVNGNDELFVDDKLVAVEDLKSLAMEFLDNNGSKSCDYCAGKGLEKFSDSPKKAIISIKNENETSYEFYIKVQDELTKAYYELRRNYATSILGKKEKQLTESEIKILRNAYPFKLSEAN